VLRIGPSEAARRHSAEMRVRADESRAHAEPVRRDGCGDRGGRAAVDDDIVVLGSGRLSKCKEGCNEDSHRTKEGRAWHRGTFAATSRWGKPIGIPAGETVSRKQPPNARLT